MIWPNCIGRKIWTQWTWGIKLTVAKDSVKFYSNPVPNLSSRFSTTVRLFSWKVKVQSFSFVINTWDHILAKQSNVSGKKDRSDKFCSFESVHTFYYPPSSTDCEPEVVSNIHFSFPRQSRLFISKNFIDFSFPRIFRLFISKNFLDFSFPRIF